MGTATLAPPSSETFTVETFPDRASWLNGRKRSIGASDASAILGLIPRWASAFSVWAEKTSEKPPEEDEEVAEFIQWGNLLEPAVRSEYSRRTGRKIDYAGPYTICRSTKYPWLHCSLDGRIVGDPRGTGVYEGKTANQFIAGDWSEEIPLKYRVQLQTQLAVTGDCWGSCACLIGGSKLRWYDENMHEKFQDAMLEKLAEFWECVERGTPPETDGSEATSRALKLLYPDDNGETVVLPDNAAAVAQSLALAKETKKRAEAEEKELSNWFRAAIGDATFGVCIGGPTFSLKTQTRSEHIVKASTFRVLRTTKE